MAGRGARGRGGTPIRGGPAIRGGRGGATGGRGGAGGRGGGATGAVNGQHVLPADHVTTIGVKRREFGRGGRPMSVQVNYYETSVPNNIIHHYDGMFASPLSSLAAADHPFLFLVVSCCRSGCVLCPTRRDRH